MNNYVLIWGDWLSLIRVIITASPAFQRNIDHICRPICEGCILGLLLHMFNSFKGDLSPLIWYE